MNHYKFHKYFNFFNRHFPLLDHNYNVGCVKNSRILSSFYEIRTLSYKIKANIDALLRFSFTQIKFYYRVF